MKLILDSKSLDKNCDNIQELDELLSYNQHPFEFFRTRSQVDCTRYSEIGQMEKPLTSRRIVIATFHASLLYLGYLITTLAYLYFLFKEIFKHFVVNC